MAAQTEELILEINVSDSLTKTAELKQSIDQLIVERQKLAEASKSGDLQATKALEATNVAIRTQQTEYKQQQRVIDGYVASKKKEVNTANLAGNSIKANRDLLKQLTAQYIDMKNPSENATSQIKHLSDVLKDQEAAIGNTSRNVGNYKESIIQAAGSLPILGKAFQGVNAIASANPIGAVAQAAASLFQIISENKEVFDLLEQATAGVSAAAGTLRDGVVELGKSMFKTGEDGKGFGEKIYDAFVRGAKGYGVLVDGFRNFSLSGIVDGLVQVTTGIENATSKVGKAADNIQKIAAANSQAEKEQQLLNDQIRTANELNAENEVQIARLVKASKDRTKSDEDRIALLKQAQELEKSRLKEEQDNADAQIRILKKQFKDRKLNDEQEDQLSEAKIKRIELEGKSLVLQEKIQNDLNGLQQSITDEQIKNTEKANAEKDRLHKEELAQFKQTQEDLDALVAQSVSDEKDLYDAQIANIKQHNAAMLQLQQNAEKQTELIKLTGETQQQLDEEFAASNYQTFAEFYAQKKKLYTDDANALKRAEAEKTQAQQATVTAAGGFAEAFVKIVGDVAEAQGAGAEFAKVVALVQIGISEAIAIANAVVAATSAGAETGVAAIGVIPAYLATFIGITIANIGQAIALLSKPTPEASFAEGDEITSFLIGGKPHSRGGTKFYGEDGNVFEAEAGERAFIMKKSASENIGLLGQWNQFWGGKSWSGASVSHAASGGAVTDGGFAIRDTVRNATNNTELASILKDAIQNLPPTKLSLVELESKQNSRDRSINISEA